MGNTSLREFRSSIEIGQDAYFVSPLSVIRNGKVIDIVRGIFFDHVLIVETIGDSKFLNRVGIRNLYPVGYF